jgi:hypothetical protein
VKRTPLKRSTKPIRQVSVKRQGENRERARVLLAKYGPKPWKCRFEEYAATADMALQHWLIHSGAMKHHGRVNGHELKKASAWRAGRMDPDNVVPMCNFHNGWIEDHPIEAKQIGLVIR